MAMSVAPLTKCTPWTSKGAILDRTRRTVQTLRFRRRLAAAFPARGRLVVAGSRIDPSCALRRLFLFPERRFGFQIIDDEAAGVERLAAMRARHGDEHDLVGGMELGDKMAHE